MLIRNDDLYDLMKLKDGDKIKITTGMKNTQYFELAKSGKTYKRLRKLYINEKTKRWCNVLYNKRNADH